MAYEIPGFTRSYEATTDLSNSFYKFVSLSGATIVAYDGTKSPIGVLQNKPLSPGVGVFLGGGNSAGTVMISGVSRVVAGGAVNAGDNLSVDSSGAVVKASAGNAVVGVAETSASAANELVSVLLAPLGGITVSA